LTHYFYSDDDDDDGYDDDDDDFDDDDDDDSHWTFIFASGSLETFGNQDRHQVKALELYENQAHDTWAKWHFFQDMGDLPSMYGN
jgi:hypothetical protein